MVRGGRCWRTVAVWVEGGSCLRKGTAEKAEVGRLVIVGMESQAKREAVGTLARLVSMENARHCHVPYLVEGRYDFPEAHREALQHQVSFQCL